MRKLYGEHLRLRALLPALASIATGKAVVGGLLAVLAVGSARGFPPTLSLAHIFAFGIVGGWLWRASARDPRGRLLGAAFLLVASAFADSPIVKADSPATLRGLATVPVDAFVAAVVWGFAADFPRCANERINRFGRWSVALCLALGAALALVTVLSYAVPGFGGESIAKPVGRARYGHYWDLINGAVLASLAYMLVRMRWAGPTERRRTRLFVGVLIVGTGPFLVVSYGANSGLLSWGPGFGLVEAIVYGTYLAVPLTLAYVVATSDVLDVRVLARRAVQYAFARATVITATALPFAALALTLYRHRGLTLAELVSGTQAITLATVGILGLGALRVRLRLYDAIDRHFLRERYDPRQVLSRFARGNRDVADGTELALLVERALDDAMHPASVALLHRDRATASLRSGDARVPELALGSPAAALLEECDGPILLPESGVWPPALLQWWGVGTDLRLALPLFGSDGALIGVLLMGPKVSEQPYGDGDLDLIEAIASSAALTLENRHSTQPPDATTTERGAMTSSAHRVRIGAEDRTAPIAAPGRAPHGAAAECVACGLVQRSAGSCSACSRNTAPAALPLVIAGKYRIEQRLGRGGMGVVYRATDVTLARAVAIKTLLHMAPRRARNLRREARSMAAVFHPNLALIYGAETTAGQPLLVVEYCEGGTLAGRLKTGPLEPSDALVLGARLARALQVVHSAAMLHRDIKPANIGFTASGEPKLLDFGLARLFEAGHGREGARPLNDFDSLVTFSSEHGLVGTPLYMSPEALGGATPDPSFDIWSLALVVYEAIAGVNPFLRRTREASLACICGEAAPDLRGLRPETPEIVAALMSRCLARGRRRRPQSARQLGDLFDDAARSLGESS